MEISYTGDCGSIEVVVEQQYGPETREEWKKRITANLKERIDEINTVGKQSDEYEKYFNKDRVVVEKCQIKTCSAKAEAKSWHIKGGVLHVMRTCENGH